MTGNGFGNHHPTIEADLAAYDDAPPPLRWLMRNTVGKWASEPLVNLYWRGRCSVGHDRTMASMSQMVVQRTRADTLAAYGPSHPDAAVMTEHFA